jgi:hypothetical protein
MDALPEPAAISGGSLRKSIGTDTTVSHTRNSTKMLQKARLSFVLEAFVMLISPQVKTGSGGEL